MVDYFSASVRLSLVFALIGGYLFMFAADYRPSHYANEATINKYGSIYPNCSNPQLSDFTFNTAIEYDCGYFNHVGKLKCSDNCLKTGERWMYYITNMDYLGCYKISLRNGTYSYITKYFSECYDQVNIEEIRAPLKYYEHPLTVFLLTLSSVSIGFSLICMCSSFDDHKKSN